MAAYYYTCLIQIIEDMLKVVFYSIIMLLLGVKTYEMQETSEENTTSEYE